MSFSEKSQVLAPKGIIYYIICWYNIIIYYLPCKCKQNGSTNQVLSYKIHVELHLVHVVLTSRTNKVRGEPERD